jgi:hypothetical protein
LDIDGWLRGIGLVQYTEMFRANDIELLGRLSNDDLKEIGVESFGHRKKLLEANAELAGAFPVSPAPAIEPTAHDTARFDHGGREPGVRPRWKCRNRRGLGVGPRQLR